ncbi:insulinase family protein [Litoribacter alkaliphilus]|uniref:Insulinase family protein n=1 Tax=Litoribacter ruber TaxID=702568 RepID=A0AAP2CNI8_9BACT|nr:pitrilysin family protein [Litoribacter alkaliphilus]MBS9524997.1 insulinase family protein [Litoribacter alkaliphilus]
MSYNIKELPNGIRIVHQEVTHTRLIHCGFILDIGSRDETKEQEGIAHFWEHMAFKGTKKRKAFHILNRLDSVGGELNAYTTKEKICFYSTILKEHFNKAAELLCDITFNSVFPEKQIERERHVILEEMAMYRDSPEDAIQDDFDAQIFENHALGRNILGREETVSSFAQQDFFDFLSTRLDTSRIIFSVVGNISFSKVLKQVEKYLLEIPVKKRLYIRSSFSSYKPTVKTIEKDISQSLCAIGKPSLDLYHENRFKLHLLNNILGGPSMNSRLNLALREKHGYVYSVESTYQSYTDTGFLGIFYGTEPKNANKAKKLVLKEMEKLRTQKLGTMQLHMAKEQAIGQMAMAEENHAALMLVLGKTLLDKGKIDDLDTIFGIIQQTTAEQLQDLANEQLAADEFSYLTYLPK